ncbi:MAG: hypothetical protein U1F48_10115 [Burkholderiales bacterium]|nr:hypothetical protein [Candidatus Hydrogenedentota bacterium]
MKPKFEVQVSPEYLAKIEADLRAGMKMLASENAFTDYNRGGGPGGNYDRHYDKSTGGDSQVHGEQTKS